MGIRLSIIVMCVFVAQAGAAFDLGVTETFDDDLGTWRTNGAVSHQTSLSGNGYAKFGRLGSNDNSWMAHKFRTTEEGYYSLSFDYRWVGVDLLPNHNDLARAGIRIEGRNRTIVSGTSEMNMTNRWTRVIRNDAVFLEADEDYALFFQFKEDDNIRLWKQWALTTSLNIDNISLGLSDNNNNLPSVVPAPGAMLLGSLGVALVGWFRKRRVL